ncbi:GAF domain-containing protein [Longimicrobium terrae]|uniref:GAF domain-containing protein n=1 Tax=Longimicrobium terrae TaxID=1639882 RepID=A0A841GIP3_9BACT|nr:GAF domain-containing protein [Longimicrobium terrae]MBB4634599.1 GAF domain-containing protein [Longimicrobium terrae]MBB6068511.1 GAF domain-containing protein [Longimicrobium terrae]NNC27701.1 GAF domain-containing protein [Longimicrobium terrae]
MNQPDPLHSEERLQEIIDLDLLAPEVDSILTEIASQAAGRLEMPVSLVSVVLDEALHVAGSHGIDGLWLGETRGHPVEWAFCATSVRSREAFVVESAVTHPYHQTNPLVTRDGVRCYAGVPMISSRGHVLGNLCVVGLEERKFSDEEVQILRDLASEAVRRIEARVA